MHLVGFYKNKNQFDLKYTKGVSKNGGSFFVSIRSEIKYFINSRFMLKRSEYR